MGGNLAEKKGRSGTTLGDEVKSRFSWGGEGNQQGNAEKKKEEGGNIYV